MVDTFFAQRYNGRMFIGRQYETRLIQEKLADTSKAQLIILYGRRRVGKSTLIRKSLKRQKNVLFFEGIQGRSTRDQIDQFLVDLSTQTGRVKLAAKNWREAFQGLEETIQKGRWFLVLDELPWMAAGRSQMISDLKLFWDRWSSSNRNLVLFLCGSVASFMVKHLIHSKSLHNRKTLEIHLMPLSPAETSLFIPKRSFWEKAQLYMTLGGIPKYLEQINPRLSIEKNINQLCFCTDGFFLNEFETLFKEQFKGIKTYENIVRLLARQSMNISELSTGTKMIRGGGLQSYVDNLIRANFVREYSPYKPNYRKRARTKLYKLVDPFLIFYFHYIEPHLQLIKKNKAENLFRAITGTSINQYYGFAFERLCEDSFETVLRGLNLKLADLINFGPYFQQKKSDGSRGLQIDNLIMRQDKVWTIIEYKYSKELAGLSVIREVEQKTDRLPVPAHISIETALISAAGAKPSVHKSGFFNHILTLSDLLQSRGK
jgi:predicted AAA+ superfamily ATPase